MTMLTKRIHGQLTRNGRAQREAQETGRAIDFRPVVKLFNPSGAATWLLTEVEPTDPDIAFGLCDLGQGFPELGTVRLSELEAARNQLGLPIERDRYFRPGKTLSAYVDDARARGFIEA